MIHTRLMSSHAPDKVTSEEARRLAGKIFRTSGPKPLELARGILHAYRFGAGAPRLVELIREARITLGERNAS